MKVPGTLISEYQEKTVKMAVWSLQIITYRLSTKYVCIVNNVDPGATICRESASTREAAQRRALERANQYLSGTITLDPFVPDAIEPSLAKIVQPKPEPSKTFTVAEFLGVPLQDRMKYILSGTLAFVSDQNQLIPAGTAMKLLSEASA
ncbi:MAG: hypothetical protein H7Y17_09490 [Chlorobia bacterium]|nr:hypothetical protein [Fimbriimonadaceae bacterium]